TRGAQGCVRITPTGLPDCTSSVSSSASVVSSATIASYAAHDRAALPVPPYTTRSSGRSALAGSRLFISIRSGASVCHERAESSVPVAAWIGRRGLVVMDPCNSWTARAGRAGARPSVSDPRPRDADSAGLGKEPVQFLFEQML